MENTQEQMNALYNPGTEAKLPQSTFTDYRPSAAKGTNNVYSAIIRFIPWWKDPKHGSIRDKWSCWLVDPLTEKGRGVDCPTSIGKPSILQDMYFKCKNSENAALNMKQSVFSRRHVYGSLIQIIKDDQNPDLVGKILPWKYGVKIFDKLDAELNPIVGDKHDPFDILNGKIFALVITKVSGFNNYDQSKFMDKKIPLMIADENGKMSIIDANTDKTKVFEYVKTESPDLEEFADFTPWTQDTHDYVNQIIQQVTGETTSSSNYAAAAINTAASDNSGVKVEEGIMSQDLNLEELSGGVDTAIAGLDLDLPDLDSAPQAGGGITGNLDDALKDL